MSEITVENLGTEDIVTGEGAPKTFAESLIERGDGDFVESAETAPEREPVAFQTSGGEVGFEAAPKKRGRPKAEAKPKPRAEEARASTEAPRRRHTRATRTAAPISTCTRSWSH